VVHHHIQRKICWLGSLKKPMDTCRTCSSTSKPCRNGCTDGSSGNGSSSDGRYDVRCWNGRYDLIIDATCYAYGILATNGSNDASTKNVAAYDAVTHDVIAHAAAYDVATYVATHDAVANAAAVKYVRTNVAALLTTRVINDATAVANDGIAHVAAKYVRSASAAAKYVRSTSAAANDGIAHAAAKYVRSTSAAKYVRPTSATTVPKILRKFPNYLSIKVSLYDINKIN